MLLLIYECCLFINKFFPNANGIRGTLFQNKSSKFGYLSAFSKSLLLLAPQLKLEKNINQLYHKKITLHQFLSIYHKKIDFKIK